MAVVFAVACGSSPPLVASSTPSSPTSASPSFSPTATANPTALPSPTPSALLDDNFGFVIGGGVKRESDLTMIFSLGIGNVSGVVSHDGRRLAYWAKTALRVIDITPNATPRTLLTVTAKGESGYNLAWSSDSTGIVVAVNGAPPIPAPDAMPAYTALRAVDVAGGQPREIARIAGANVVPLVWDRTAHLIAAYEPLCCSVFRYDTITEDGLVKRTPLGSELLFLKASRDAKFVFGSNLEATGGPFSVTTLLRVWPVGASEAGISIRSVKGGAIRTAEWRPGTDEIGVLFDDRLELWAPDGTRRTISLPNLPKLAPTNPNASLLFRADGKAVFISLQTSTSASAETVVLDLDTDASEDMMWGGVWPPTGTSVRLVP